MNRTSSRVLRCTRGFIRTLTTHRDHGKLGLATAVHEQKFGGLDRESFNLLATRMIPLTSEFFRPVSGKLEVGAFSMSLPFRKEFIGNPQVPCLHGGTVAALFDHVAGLCAWSALESACQRVSTVDLRVDYLLPAPCETLYFDATVVSKTKKLIRVDVVCWDNARSKQIALGRCLFNIYGNQSDMNILVEKFRIENNM